MSFSKQKNPAPIAAPPPPPDDPVTKLAPAIDKATSDNAIRLGTRSLRIDRTSTAVADGSGLNLPS